MFVFYDLCSVGHIVVGEDRVHVVSIQNIDGHSGCGGQLGRVGPVGRRQVVVLQGQKKRKNRD